MRVLVAMSGGVDSSVAAALCRDAGHEVTGVTLKLWGGRGDSGCCSVADVEDARRVAAQLGIDHHVFNYSEEFEEAVVGPYVAEHAAGRTPNPCIECNRRVKFGLLAARARRLGFDAVATGHHARVAADGPEGAPALRRGRDLAKDQSYVLSVLTAADLGRLLLPVGELCKADVRAVARDLGLRTASKPDSQDVCFIASRTPGEGRSAFLSTRITLHPGAVVDAGTGERLGSVSAVELVTVGQRRGLGAVGRGERSYAVSVDTGSRTVRVGGEADMLVGELPLNGWTWVGEELAPGTSVLAQASAHGHPFAATVDTWGIRPVEPRRRVAPGQTVALYVADAGGDRVVGSALAA
jgi:tRNA-specific 2-thiouridylase